MGCNTFNFNGCFAVPIGTDYTMWFGEDGDDSQATDFTGYTFLMTIQDKITKADLLSMPVVGDDQTTGIYIPDPTNGEIFIQIRKADTVTVGKGDRIYNIKITDPSGNETLFSYGGISFIEVD